jgi:hypothetical protein
MRRLNLSIAIVLALIPPAVGLLAAAPAMAYNVSAVYRDCETNGQLTAHYSSAELQAALNSIPSQLAEYSDCQAIIQHALLAASTPAGAHHNGSRSGGGAGSGGKNGGGSGPTGGGNKSSHGHGASTSTAAFASGSADKAATSFGGSSIHPVSAGSARSLPAVLVVVLILLALTALSGGAVAIRRRLVARHGT